MLTSNTDHYLNKQNSPKLYPQVYLQMISQNHLSIFMQKKKCSCLGNWIYEPDSHHLNNESLFNFPNYFILQIRIRIKLQFESNLKLILK